MSMADTNQVISRKTMNSGSGGWMQASNSERWTRNSCFGMMCQPVSRELTSDIARMPCTASDELRVRIICWWRERFAAASLYRAVATATEGCLVVMIRSVAPISLGFGWWLYNSGHFRRDTRFFILLRAHTLIVRDNQFI